MNTTIRKWCENIMESPKRVAVPIMTHPGIELIGATVYEAVTNGEIHAQAIKALYQHYRSAAVTMIMDLTVEAEAFGCQIKFEKDEIPTVTGKLIANREEAALLSVPEPTSSKRVREYLKAAELTIKDIQDTPVFPGCIGPFSLAGRLLDMTEIMTAIYLDPDLVQALLQKCSLFIKQYIKAYKLMGAAGVILAEPASGLLGEEECNLYSSDYIKKIVEEFQDENFLIVLHNCGHNGFLARSMASTGARALHFGNAADMTLVLKEVPDDILVMGNLDPVNVLQTGDPEFVKQKTTELLENTGNYPNFVLSSGCDLPPGVPQKNIQAFFEALDAYNDLHVIPY
ncbi:MAG: uroporphyrinogen decarboxylase family protein [Mangrovibacterium sp.]|nr:uroporphyrinogen decarboxylase family protein [Mangrovibacterium sp.]